MLTACTILPCLNGFSVTAPDTLTDDSVVSPAPEASESDNVYITVQFASDYLEDETYLEPKAARENAKSRQNAYSKSYHQTPVTWLVKATPVPYNQSGGDCYVPDYNIYLYNPSGLVVAQSLYSDGNVELLRYVASVSGTYKLKIVANENVSQTITCGLSISW